MDSRANRITGEITDQEDVDSFTFFLDSGEAAVIVVNALPAPQSVAYSATDPRPVTIYSGRIIADTGGGSAWVTPALHSSRVIVGTGRDVTLTLDAVDTANRNGNPGPYEIQVLRGGYPSSPRDPDTIVGNPHP